MKDSCCQVISNQEIGPTYFRLVFEKHFVSFQPGQFCMVKVPALRETLLRRPLSLCQEHDGQAEIVYKVIGPFTRALSQLATGAHFWVLGPLGRGFDWSVASRVIGIAGGYGIAPMLGLGNRLQVEGSDYEVYYGVRSQSDLLLCDDFATRGIPLHISTEDGSSGFKGVVIDLLKKRKKEVTGTKTVWFVCGPHGFLQAAAALAKRWEVPCYASVEAYMGCGIGVCLGCVVETTDGHYVRSCVEGPVMNSKAIIW